MKKQLKWEKKFDELFFNNDGDYQFRNIKHDPTISNGISVKDYISSLIQRLGDELVGEKENITGSETIGQDGWLKGFNRKHAEIIQTLKSWWWKEGKN